MFSLFSELTSECELLTWCLAQKRSEVHQSQRKIDVVRHGESYWVITVPKAAKSWPLR